MLGQDIIVKLSSICLISTEGLLSKSVILIVKINDSVKPILLLDTVDDSC